MPKTSFARPGAPASTAPPAPAPRPRPGAPAPSTAAPVARTAPPAPAPRPRPGAPAPAVTATTPPPRAVPGRPARPVAPVAELPPTVEVEVLPPEETAAPAPVAAAPAPRRRGRPPTAAVAAPAAPSQQVAVVNNELAPMVIFTGRLGAIEGDIDSDDVTRPQLKIGNKVGPLSLLENPIQPGALVVGAGEQWTYVQDEGWEPLGVTILRTRKQFAQIKNERGQKLYDLDEQGLMVETKEEMKANGGTLSDVLGLKVFEAVMLAHVFVRMPTGLEDTMGLFNVEIDGEYFMEAGLKLRGSSYRECAIPIYDENKKGTFFLDGRSYTGEFLMTGKRIIGDKNDWYVPHIELGQFNSEAVIAWIEANCQQ